MREGWRTGAYASVRMGLVDVRVRAGERVGLTDVCVGLTSVHMRAAGRVRAHRRAVHVGRADVRVELADMRMELADVSMGASAQVRAAVGTREPWACGRMGSRRPCEWGLGTRPYVGWRMGACVASWRVWRTPGSIHQATSSGDDD